MTERRPPGFNVDLGFYDSDEVLSIPRRFRAAAIGVWTLCGSYSANKLTDGFVSAQVLQALGCTDAIRDVLMSTTRADGTPSPLWIDGGAGAVWFTRWPKWQRTCAEVKAYRDADAERKRLEREQRKAMLTSNDSEMSGRTTGGRPEFVRPDSGTPKTKTKTETSSGYVERATYVSDAAARDTEAFDVMTDASTSDRNDDLSRPVSIGATRLVTTVIGAGKVGDADRTVLRIKASEAMHGGRSDDDVAECLRIWLTKPDLGPHALLCCLTEVDKRKLGNGQPKNKTRGLVELAQRVRAEEQAQLANHHPPKEIQ